jgi:gliding motility-associated-like protein
MLRYLFFGIILLFCSSRAYADVFTVTSNADAGAGTLRDAITQAAANGVTFKDHIYFNLPGNTPAGRTINLLTQLPDLTSNMVIDGTTQPGATLGISSAKVIISINFNDAASLMVFSIRQIQNVELYGMMLTGENFTQRATFGILVLSSKNIIIGDVGKGNVIKSIDYGLFNPTYGGVDPALLLSENVRVSGNMFGINEDGETIDAKGGCSINVRYVKDFTFGGKTRAYGNVISGQLNIDDPQSIPTGELLISHNLIGTNYNGREPLPNPINNIYILSVQRATCDITENIINYSDFTLAVNCFFKIQGNKFGTDLPNTQVFGQAGRALRLGNCSDGGIIGGTGPEEGNIISGSYQNAPFGGANIVNEGADKVEVVGNTFRCNNSNYTYSANFAPDTHFITIDTRTDEGISGTTDPGARVDLYYSSGDCPTCEPEQLFAQLQASASGKWQYTATLDKKAIIASSTLNGTTSEFTRLKFTSTAADVQITNACNDRNGSISGITVSEPVTYTWYDAANNIISTQKDLNYVSSGFYRLVVDNGFCNITSETFEIKPVTNFIPVPAVNNTEICAPGNATVKVTSPQPGETYRLYNSATDMRPLDDQPSGIFKVRVSANRSFYISRLEGSCESERVEAKVSIGVSDITIPNTITPNTDGINDVWNIKGIENYSSAQVAVYSRYGQKVYNSADGYSIPFNGTFGGQALPAGTYYYTILLSGQCKVLSGYLTILR